THVVGQNATLVIPPLEDARQAMMQVNTWLAIRTAGMVQPLPIEFDTAAVWLERQKPGQNRNAQMLEQDAQAAARNVYEVTGPYQTAARDQTPVLKRDFPDFDALAGALVADRDFFMLARELYGRGHDHPIKRVEHKTPATSDGGRP
ncbi:MAG TPA: hypothetical protein VK104_02535, partial [Burkholderiaceae bacterium]|nr:hypothetical protein [Burkholderiaceae bacterium]